jgi:hypothetical protein
MPSLTATSLAAPARWLVAIGAAQAADSPASSDDNCPDGCCTRVDATRIMVPGSQAIQRSSERHH